MKKLPVSRLEPRMHPGQDYCHAPGCWGSALGVGFCHEHVQLLPMGMYDPLYPTLEDRQKCRAFLVELTATTKKR